MLSIVPVLYMSAIVPPVFPEDGRPGDAGKLDRAVWLYDHENYDEALIPLQELRTGDPGSSTVAYYLGLTLKQMQRYKEARPHLEAAATLSPKINYAVPELIDLLYKLDEIEDAKKWVAVAEAEGVAPAQIAFMKGLILLKENKDVDGAIASFDKAGELDESLVGTVKYYKGMAYLQAKQLSKANEVFKDVVMTQPTADLATFANEYMDTISRVEDATKPFHGYATAGAQYDTNVVLMPDDETTVSGISDQADWRQVYTCQGDYNFRFGDNVSIKPGYSFYYAKQTDLGFYDMVSHDITLLPSFYFDKLAVTFPTHYNYVSVHDKGYLSTASVSNLTNYMIDRNDMAQFSFLYNRKIFLWPPDPADENRTSSEYVCSVGWYHFFAKNQGVFSLGYSMNCDDTKGENWRYWGNKLTMMSVIPVLKNVKWNIVCEYFYQDYLRKNNVYDKRRSDNIITVSNLVAIEVFKNAEVQLTYTFTDDNASIGVYKYTRNVFGAGMKYKF